LLLLIFVTLFLQWSLQDEKAHESGTPEFKMVRGGGIGPDEKFDVVSIQFAIHYMMQTRKRARRFFRTVSELLEVGGNLICTTMDARVGKLLVAGIFRRFLLSIYLSHVFFSPVVTVVGHLLNLGLNYHFDDDSWNSLKEVVVKVGGGACRISFDPKVVKKIFTATSDGSDLDENLFGLEYTFTLVEGSDHEAGVGDAVNLAEWLLPIPVLTALGKEVGLEIEYAKNFHEFYADRSDPSAFSGAHSSLYNMKVLNRNGSVSKDEWEISRLYAAIKFRKVREPVGGELEESDQEEEEDDEEEEVELDPKVKEKLIPMAMMKAKKAAGADVWSHLSSEEKKSLIEIEVVKLAKAG
jgi:mRNA (guanine-N7-)-methyltransferase